MVLGRDAASVWYNPSSIASTHRFRFDASATGYGLKVTRAPGSMVARTEERVLRSTGFERQLQVVPSAASFVFGWPGRDFALALSFHTPRFSETEARQRIGGRNRVGNYAFEQEANTVNIVRRHHAGLSLAGELADALRLGAAVAVLYDKDVGFTRFVADSDDPSTGASGSYIADLDSASRVAGLELSLGMQGELTPWLHAGAMFRTPAAVVWQRFDGGQTVGVSLVEPDGAAFTETSTDPSTRGGAPRWLTPWTVAAGLGITVHRLDVEVNAEAAPAKRNVGDAWRQRAVWNVRAGWSYRLSRRWILGTGVFTDRTTAVVAAPYPAVIIHRYGGSLAVRFRKPVALARTERVRRLVFETTVAVRYAFGLGESGSIRASYPDAGPHFADLDVEDRTEATQHLVNVHVGTGVKF